MIITLEGRCQYMAMQVSILYKRYSENIQSTKSEDGHQCKLLLPWKLKSAEDRHGIDQDQNISQNVDGGVGKPKGLLVETESRYTGIPKFGQRYAVCPGTDNCPSSVDGEESDE